MQIEIFKFLIATDFLLTLASKHHLFNFKKLKLKITGNPKKSKILKHVMVYTINH